MLLLNARQVGFAIRVHRENLVCQHGASEEICKRGDVRLFEFFGEHWVYCPVAERGKPPEKRLFDDVIGITEISDAHGQTYV